MARDGATIAPTRTGVSKPVEPIPHVGMSNVASASAVLVTRFVGSASRLARIAAALASA
ncbi:hypothetical protein [Methylobacterium fujisawaense]